MSNTETAKYRKRKNFKEFAYIQSELGDDHKIEQLSEWHFRIDGRIDVWPSTKKFMIRGQSVSNYNQIKEIFE